MSFTAALADIESKGGKPSRTGQVPRILAVLLTILIIFIGWTFFWMAQSNRDALLSAGAQQASAPNDPRARFPEAQTLLEACMLDALSRAASPLAVDLLLAQPAHWASHPDFDPTSPDAQSRARILNRLIEPPLIVAVGAPNVGKSSLLNALAGRSVALAAAQAGTTRDHVGAILDLGGLVVRWVDTPGCSDVSAPTTDPILAHAQEVASVVIASADLVLHCCDAKQGVRPPVKSAAPVLQIATRCDLAAPTPAGFVLETAAGATPQQGLPSLVQAVQDALVPAAIRKQVVPWAFHPALPTPEKRKAGPV